MHVLLAAVRRKAAETGVSKPLSAAASLYLERIQQYEHAEAHDFTSEEALVAGVGKLRARTAPMLALLDFRGRAMSSEELAAWIGRQRDSGVQNLIFAVGPADGWSESARNQADLLLSLGPLTLAHELARVVLAEQVYRAFSILAGHPYHRA